MFPALLSTLLFSISAVSANRTAKMLGGTEANFWRLVVALVFLAAYAHLLGVGLSGGAFHIFLLSGLVGFGVGDMALFQALPRLGSRLTILLVHCLASPFAAITEWWWLGTRLTLMESAAGGLILLGVALALAGPGQVIRAPRTLWIGTSFAVVAALGQAFGAVLSRKAYRVVEFAGGNVDGISAAYQRIIGGVILAGIGLLIVKRRGAAVPDPGAAEARKAVMRRATPWIVVNGMAGPALGVSCYQWALQTTPTGIVLAIVATTPLVVIPLAWRMEGERPSRYSLAGGVVAVVGAVVLALVR